MFSDIQVFKCFLCACAANDAGHEATSGPPQELAVKRLVYNRCETYFSYIQGCAIAHIQTLIGVIIM